MPVHEPNQRRALFLLSRGGAILAAILAAAFGGPPAGFGDSPNAPTTAGGVPQPYVPLPPGISTPNQVPAQGPVANTPPDQNAEGKTGEAPAKKPEAKGEGEKSDQAEKKDGEKEFKLERFNAYGQATVITQWHGPFHSPYEGPHSFLSRSETGTSVTATLFLGAASGRAARSISIPRSPAAWG